MISDVRFLHVIKLFTREYNKIVSAGSCVYLKHFNVIYHIKCLGINVCLCKTILTIRHKSKLRRDRAISLGVRDNQPSVTTAISRSNNGF